MYAEDESGPQSTKKPVVKEMYNEVVFPDPSESFYSRVQKHPAVIVPRLPVALNLPPGNAITTYFSSILLVSTWHDGQRSILLSYISGICSDDLNQKKGDTKDHPLSQWFINFSEADELLKLAAARQQVNHLCSCSNLTGI